MRLKSLLKQAKYTVKTIVRKQEAPPAPREMFAIKAGYRHREDNSFFDDTANEDFWQREVYQAAADEAKAMGAKTVFDIGCGSAFKLMKHFADIRTVGFDLEPTVNIAREKYPDREWRVSSFDMEVDEPADIVICSDVVEHIPNPDELMAFLARLKFGKLFLSTPERKLVYGFDHLGPPNNKAHCREWSFDEFRRYVDAWFDVEDHIVSNKEQGTQLAICRLR